MYKLIIGNVRVTILDDSIEREQAASAARQAISRAALHDKLISHVEISATETGLEVNVSEKTGCKMTRKTIKQSMLDGMHASIKEKLYPTSLFSQQDVWFDSDTGQEWRGSDVDTAREEILQKFEEWMKIV